MSPFARFRSRIPTLLGVMMSLISIWQFLTVVSVSFRWSTRHLRRHLDQYYFWFPSANLAWVVVLTMISAALLARKRIAWWLLFAVVSTALVNNVWQLSEQADLDALPGLIYQCVLMAMLVIARSEFTARLRPGSFLKAAVFFVVSLTISFFVGVLLVKQNPRTLKSDEIIQWTVQQILGGVGTSAGLFKGQGPAWVGWILGVMGAIVLVGTFLLAFRSQRAANAIAASDEELIRALLSRYPNDDSLAYFNTRRDKSVVFAEDGHAAIAYRVEVGVCLASSDPIGDESSWNAAISRWLLVCRRYGWVPAVMGASKRGALAYRQHGLDALELGDEAILPTGDLNLRGPERAELRQAIQRGRRSGLTVTVRRHKDIPADKLKEAGFLADHWRDTEQERGFSMALGRLGDGTDPECLLVEAYDESGKLVGMLSFVPWGRNGASLDVMRRSPDAPNGTTEFMVSEFSRQAEGFGVSRFSLNFAVFRSVFDEGAQLGAGPFLRVWRRVLLFLSKWWQLESLYRANEKYGPTWVPRFIAFADRRMLPRIGLASAMAEGFVTIPGFHATPRKPITPPTQAPIAPHQLREIASPTRTVKRPEQVRVRIDKASRLTQSGVDPWPEAEVPTHAVAQALQAPHGERLSVAGRVVAHRDFGGVAFVKLRDWSGDIQVLLDAERISPDTVQTETGGIDLGDLLHVDGVRGVSRRGEESLLADAVHLNAKCLHPLPDKRQGLADPEARIRQRHVDLFTSDVTRSLARKRSAVLQSLRTNLYNRGFLEVETPILQAIHGGANARPFQTHINAYNMDLYLRIAPELYLKRLCVGGMEKIFEIGRAFRNEGVDYSHNPEFTILEAYEAHSDYIKMARMCQDMIQQAAIAANGVCAIPGPDGKMVDISGDWPMVTVHDAVSKALEEAGGQRVTAESSVEELRAMCDFADVAYRDNWDEGELILELYEQLVEEFTTFPTFYCDYPVSVSPLTRKHRSTPGVTEKWDLVAFGMELGTAYSELTDPIDQRQRLTDQSVRAADGDPEAMELDEDFLSTLEYGMPPTGGLGMGVDRVVMLVTGASIRDTLPFPLAKPKGDA